MNGPMPSGPQAPEPATTLSVNGVTHTIACEEETLLHVLRNRLGLRATRYGCGIQACGACMVLVDGVPSYSCTARAADLAGRSVETAESLLSDPDDALIRAFIDEQAGQCGYCLSGILISARALLRAVPRPSAAAVAAALDPHLCRCGAQNRIVKAVLRAAEAATRGDA